MTKNKRLKQIKGRLDAATKGKWHTLSLGDLYSNVNYEDGFSLFSTYFDGSVYTSKYNAEFISNSKEDIQYLLDLVEHLQNENKNIKNDDLWHDYTLSQEQYKAFQYKKTLDDVAQLLYVGEIQLASKAIYKSLGIDEDTFIMIMNKLR